MMRFERDYLELVSRAINDGDKRIDRTKVGTRALFATQIRHDWADGFPLITHRKLMPTGAFGEMYCFMNGFTNNKTLKAWGCNFWDANLKAWNERTGDLDNSDLGSVYGAQWRNFNGVDQLQGVINEAKANPTSRRLLVSCWNPAEMDEMCLPPCYYSFQLFIKDGRLSMLVNMRSVDLILGLPSDIAGHAFLQVALSQILGLKLGELVFNMADTHVYENHIETAKKMIDDTFAYIADDVPYPYVADFFWNKGPINDLIDFVPTLIMTAKLEQGPKYYFQMAV